MYHYDNSKREIRAYALHNVLSYFMKEHSRYNYQNIKAMTLYLEVEKNP